MAKTRVYSMKNGNRELVHASEGTMLVPDAFKIFETIPNCKKITLDVEAEYPMQVEVTRND